MKYPFTEEEFNQANAEWGCNCGPSALAFALQKPLAAARYAIRDFEKKRYTSITMMRRALAELSVEYEEQAPFQDYMFDFSPALTRIQWDGPWMVNARAACAHTHWIATWCEAGRPCRVFDCNGGVRDYDSWINTIVPLLMPKRGTGWAPTHVWRLRAQ